MAVPPASTPTSGFSRLVRWIDYRLPVFTLLEHELVVYPTPKNLNYWWNFGSLAGIVLVIMILTGIFLAMNYTPNAELAFGSVETVALFMEGSAEPAANRTAIIEFQVDDVEAEFARLKDQVEVVHEPRLMPWGNCAAQFRDPEGTLVGLYTPVSEAAKKRFGSR